MRTFNWQAIGEALEAGARNTLVVALACASASIVIGSITLAGLGLSFTGVVLALLQNTLILALILTLLAGTLLGMGLPTTPAYIVQLALLVPALKPGLTGYIIPFMFVFTPSLLLIKPGRISNLIGLALIAVIIASQGWLKPANAPTAPHAKEPT